MKDNQKNKKGSKTSKKNNNLFLGVVAVIVIGIAAFTFLNSGNDEESLVEQPKSTAISATDDNGDLVIKVADVTETAKFYGYDELETYMEILAVKASDGTVRTAFNTCQVCYSSGRGYYIQEGDVLVCQNCGNRFRMDEVEVAKGGCNPVPIFKEMKEATDTTITIPKELFAEAEGILQIGNKRWFRNYAKVIRTKIIKLGGVTCTACEYKIEKALKKLEGVNDVKVSYASSTADIIYDTDKIDLKVIYDTIEKVGYDVIHEEDDSLEEDSSKTTTLLIFLIIAGLYVIINNTVGFNIFPQITQSMGYGMLFVAGLFTSVHCIAMCGGINLSQCAGCNGCENNNIYSKLKPSFLYNLGRVTSYTILGGLVGALGSVFSLSLKGKSVISLIAGTFMIIMGVNMLGITPMLRKIMPRLPKVLTDKIDRKKTDKGPFIVGLLNGFMPCGPLQAMQLYALGTGSFITGAFSMLLFSLGTVPIMFAFGAFSSILSSKFTKQMMKISAILVIILGIVMGNRGFSLAGINIADAVLSPLGINLDQDDKVANAVIKDGYQTITTKLESGKYQPIIVYEGVPLRWSIEVDKGTLNGCNNEIIIPEYKLQRKLELGENIIEFTPTKTGTITYTCWMGMISSTITVK